MRRPSRPAWTPTRRASPGSAPTSRSTRSPSRSPRRSTASSRRTPIRSTSARARSSSRRGRTPGGAPGSTRSPSRRASRSAASSSRPCSTVTSCCPTAPCGWPSTSSAARTGAPARRCCWAMPRTPRTSRSARAPSSPSRTRSSSPLPSGATTTSPTALVEYELERRPVVERFQEAARQSAEYFEEVPRHWGLPPLQFAFNLLTRSGRIGHANLSLRDPRLVRRVDAFLGGRGALAPPPLFAPLELHGLTLANRAVVRGLDEPRRRGPVPVAGRRGHARRADHARRPGRPRRLARRRRGHPRGGRRRDARAEPRRPARRLPAARRGRRPPAARRAAGRWSRPRRSRTAAAAPRPPSSTRRAWSGSAPRSSTRRGAAPRRGSTPSSSTSARATCSARSSRRARTAARTRTARTASLPAVGRRGRARCVRRPARRPALRRREHAAALREAGADLVHVATGQATEGAAAEYRRGHLTAFSDRIRSEAHVATMVGGYLDTLDAANTIVGAGRADLCLLEPAAFT